MGMEKDTPPLAESGLLTLSYEAWEKLFGSAVDFWYSVQSSSENDNFDAAESFAITVEWF